jgi:hypothetical protein
MADKNLKISVQAVNNAKKALDDVKSQLGGITKEMEKTTKASNSQTASVFKGVAMWDMFKKSVGLATDFLRASVKESMETARMAAQTATNVRNAGFAFEDLAGKMKQVGESAIKMGFDDDTAKESLSRLLLVTKDVTQAQALLNLSMDLSRNKNIGLQEATKAITLVTQGNSRALKELGIDLRDGASTADLLTEAQEKLKGSASAFAETTAGKMAILNEQWDNMKQEIGDGMTPAITEFMQVVNDNMPTIIEMFRVLAHGISVTVGWIAKLAGSEITKFADSITSTLSKNQELIDSLIKAEKAGDQNAKGLRKQLEAYSSAEVSILKLKKAQDLLNSANEKGYLDAVKMKEVKDLTVTSGIKILAPGGVTKDVVSDLIGQVNKKIEENNAILNKNQVAYDKVSASVVVSGNAFKGMANMAEGSSGSIKETEEKAEDLASSLKTLSKQFNDLGESADDALYKLSEQHQSSLENFKKQLVDIRNQIQATTVAFNKQKGQDQMSVAESIVANDERIAEIQKTLAGEVEKTKRRELEAELLTRQEAEVANADFIASVSDQVAEVKRRNSLSDLERAIEDFNSKRVLAEQEYSESISRLQKEANEIKKQRDAEKRLYNEKVSYIKNLDEEAKLNLAKSLITNTLNTKTAIEKQIEYYKSLAEAIRASQSADVGGISRIQSKMSKNTLTGISTGGGNSVNININTMVGDDQYAEELGNKIIKVLAMQNQINN